MAEHTWVAIAAFRLTPDEVRRAAETPIMLDSTKLMERPMVGCYECEAVFEGSPQLDEECPGDPANK